MLVVDIETNLQGKVLAIGSVLEGSTDVHIFNGWKEFLPYAYSLDETKWIGHNAGKFDYLSLLEHLLYHETNIRLRSWEAIENDGSIIFCKLTLNSKQFTLFDSYRLIPTSLDTLAKELVGLEKKEINTLPEKLSKSNLHSYLENDCLILSKSLLEFDRQLHKLGYKREVRPITIAQASLATFEDRTGLRYRQISRYVNDIGRQAYNGGRVQVFKHGVFKQVNVYDVNSMYPYVMFKHIYPINSEYHLTTNFKDLPGLWLCDFHHTGISPIYRKGEEVKKTTKEPIWLTTEEAKNVKLTKVHRGFTFINNEYIFKDYVLSLYEQRTKKTGLGFVSKLLMNSLYGKFAQREDCASIVYSEDMPKPNWTPLSMGKAFYSVPSTRVVVHQFVPVSALITANARMELYRYLDGDTIYCDTDSIHTTKHMDTDISIGGLKLEFSGQGIYVGKKLYCLKGDSVIVKAKGVKTHGNPLYGGYANLTWKDYLKMDNGLSVVCRYDTMPTLREVIDGERSCSVKKRIRTLRKL